MSRRRKHLVDDHVEQAVVDQAAADELSARLAEVLHTLSARRVAVLYDAVVNHLTAQEIAVRHGISKAKVRNEFTRAINSLRHPSRALALAEFGADRALVLQEDYDEPALRRILAGSALGLQVEQLKCEIHGWRQVVTSAARCEQCPCELPTREAQAHTAWPVRYVLFEPGRPRKYCSDACRQRAYRRRKQVVLD